MRQSDISVSVAIWPARLWNSPIPRRAEFPPTHEYTRLVFVRKERTFVFLDCIIINILIIY